MPIGPTGKAEQLRSLLAAAGIAAVGIISLLIATLIARWIELQLY